MKFAIIPIEVIELSGTTSEFNIGNVMHGVIFNYSEGKYKVSLEAEYTLGTYDSLDEALKAVSQVYILLAFHDSIHCVSQLKECVAKFAGIDFQYLL